MMIAITATDSTIFPHASPEAKGTEPIAACTVAFGRYAITQKARSFHDRFVFATQSNTTARVQKLYDFAKVVCDKT